MKEQCKTSNEYLVSKNLLTSFISCHAVRNKIGLSKQKLILNWLRGHVFVHEDKYVFYKKYIQDVSMNTQIPVMKEPTRV